MSFIPATHHKSYGVDSTPRGPARWERAARNAIKRPHSQAAQLYRERYNLALTIAETRIAMAGGKDSAWQFMGNRTRERIDKATGRREFERYRTRRYATCSTFCTVMQITLDFSTTNPTRVAEAFRVKEPETYWTLSLEPFKPSKRKISCQVCGRQVR